MEDRERDKITADELEALKAKQRDVEVGALHPLPSGSPPLPEPPAAPVPIPVQPQKKRFDYTFPALLLIIVVAAATWFLTKTNELPSDKENLLRELDTKCRALYAERNAEDFEASRKFSDDGKRKAGGNFYDDTAPGGVIRDKYRARFHTLCDEFKSKTGFDVPDWYPYVVKFDTTYEIP